MTAVSAYACERCRDTGIVPTRVGGEWDRPGHVEMPCHCAEPPRRMGHLGDDAGGSLDLCIRAKRERLVRAGAVPPLNEAERRQAAEGPVADSSMLDCARGL